MELVVAEMSFEARLMMKKSQDTGWRIVDQVLGDA